MNDDLYTISILHAERAEGPLRRPVPPVGGGGVSPV